MGFTWSESPTPLFGIGQDFGGVPGQMRPPLAAEDGAHTTEVYGDDVEMNISETGQLTAAGDNQPTITHSYYTGPTPRNLEYPQDGHNLLDIGTFDWLYEEGNQVVLPALTQEAPSWGLWDPMKDPNNPHLDGMLSESSAVNAEDTDGFNSHVDIAMRPPSITNSQTVDTRARLHELSPLFPGHPVTLTLLCDYDLTLEPVGSNPFVLTRGAVPLPSSFPASDQHGLRAAETSAARQAYAFDTPVAEYHGDVMYPAGQLGGEAPSSEVNSDRSALLVCPICGNEFCNAGGLRRHRKIHTGEDARHVCNKLGCGAVFRWPKDLRRHWSTHNRLLAIPARCEEEGCDKTYVRHDHLLRHLRAKHANSPTAVQVLMRSARPDRRQRLLQPSNSAEKRQTGNMATVGEAMMSSNASGSRSSVSPEQRIGPALPYRTLMPVPERYGMAYGMPASTTSYSPSLLTPDAAGSMSMVDDTALPRTPGTVSSSSALRE